jgi:SCY1-like protein 1
LQDSASSFPPEFASYKILPALISALEFGGVSAAVVLPLVLQLGKNVPTEDYPTAIVGPLVNLFARPDRGSRMALLEHLPEFADRLDKKAVVDKIWPHLVRRPLLVSPSALIIFVFQQSGFTDTVAIIREATVKSIILISPKVPQGLA